MAKRAAKKRAAKKESLSPQQKAARTRKRNRIAKERALADRRERARIRREERALAEQIASEELAKELRGLTARESYQRILESMVPPRWRAQFVPAEIAARKRLPYSIVIKMIPPRGTSYAQVGKIVEAWRLDLILEARINPQRIAAIRIAYRDPDGKERQSMISKAGAWELVVSEIAGELGDSPDALAQRYKKTRVIAVYVYFADEIARTNIWIPHYQRAA